MPLTPAEKTALKVIDEVLGYQSRHAGLPGFQACIRKKGEKIFSKAYGFANPAKKEKYTTKHKGRLASHSKMFTMALAFALQEKGVLTLDDPVVKHLPELEKHKDKRFREVTLRDLLTNRAGIGRDGTDAAFWELKKPFPDRAALLKDVLALPLYYEPNTEMKYSNTGFSLLGAALAAAGGADYAALVQKHVLSKLPGQGLVPDYSKTLSPMATGHSRTVLGHKREVMAHAPAKAFAPAAGFCGTAEDISAFLHALLFTDRILPARIRREVKGLRWPVGHAPDPRDSYGLGLMFSSGGDKMYLGHSGGWPGFVSQTRHVSGTDYIISLVFNANYPWGFFALRGIAEILEKIGGTFTSAELRSAEVTGPFMNRWGSEMYVVAAKKALALALDGWMPAEGATVLDREKKGKGYLPRAVYGYFSPGEPVFFGKKNGKTEKVRCGGYTDLPEKQFLRGMKLPA